MDWRHIHRPKRHFVRGVVQPSPRWARRDYRTFAKSRSIRQSSVRSTRGLTTEVDADTGERERCQAGTTTFCAFCNSLNSSRYGATNRHCRAGKSTIAIFRRAPSGRHGCDVRSRNGDSHNTVFSFTAESTVAARADVTGTHAVHFGVTRNTTLRSEKCD